MTVPAVQLAPQPGALWTDCRLCGCRLMLGTGDDMKSGLCRDHKNDPRAKHLVVAPAATAKTPRPFTPADKALIKSLHHLPAKQLLDILNSRLVADVGTTIAPYTMEQLFAEWQALDAAAAQAGDWAGLRKVIAVARRAGVLAAITSQAIDDFCIVFQLTSAQKMHVVDVIANAQEDR